MKLGIIFVLAIAASAHAQSRQADFIRNLAQKPPTLTAFPQLLNALEDKDPKVRMEALKAWAKVGKKYVDLYTDELNEQTIESKDQFRAKTQAFHQSLVNKIKPSRRDDQGTKLEAIRTLCKLGDSADTVCPLIFGCGTGRNLYIEYKIDIQLGIEAEENRGLLKILVDDPDPDVVFNVLNALGSEFQITQLGLAKKFLADPNKYFRGIGLNMIRESWPDSSSNLVSPFLDDPDEDVRVTAETCLRLTEDQAALLARPNPHISVNLRRFSLQQLEYSEDHKWDKLFEVLLHDEDGEIRSVALSYLFANEKSRKPESIQPFLSDPSPMVRAVAIKVASRSPGPNFVELVRTSLLSPESCIREAALYCLGTFPDGEQLSEEQVKCVELGVKFSYEARPGFEDPRFPGLLEKCLTSKNPEIRLLVARHFSSPEDRSGPADIMIKLAKDPNSDVAICMIAHLGDIADPWAYQTLVELLSSPDQSIRLRAISVLERSKRPSAIAALQPLTVDQDQTIRIAAKYAVKNLKEKLPKP